MSDNTRQNILDALHELIDREQKVSIKAVANHAGLSHSVIYNRYPDLKCIIRDAQLKQAEHRDRNEERDKLLKLKHQLDSIKRKSQRTADDKKQLPALLAHIQQVYSMYDQLTEDHAQALKRLRELERKLTNRSLD